MLTTNDVLKYAERASHAGIRFSSWREAELAAEAMARRDRTAEAWAAKQRKHKTT